MGVVYTRINDRNISGTPSTSFNVVNAVYEVVISIYTGGQKKLYKIQT